MRTAAIVLPTFLLAGCQARIEYDTTANAEWAHWGGMILLAVVIGTFIAICIGLLADAVKNRR